LVVLLLAFAMVILPAMATEDHGGVLGSGTCGEALTWVLYEDGHLVVEGSGEMRGSAWYSLRESIRSVSLPEGLTSIGDYAFYECKNMVSDLEIPDSVTTIGYGAFYKCGCSGILTLPKKLTTIGDFAFSEVRFDGNLTIPDGVVSIGKSAFSKTGFTGTLELPDSVTTIGDYAFFGVPFTGSLTIPHYVTEIGSSAFCQTGFTGTLTIPDSVTTIGNHAFYLCGFTGSLTIPGSVESIGEEAFAACVHMSGLLTVEAGVGQIGSFAFDSTEFESVLFVGDAPETGDHILGYRGEQFRVFYYGYCEGWTSETWNGYASKDISPEIIDSGNCGEHLSWVLNNRGELVITGSGAMEDYELLFGIGYGYEVNRITEIHAQSTSPWQCYRTLIRSIVLPDGLTGIGNAAFVNCRYTEGELVLPEGLVTIGECAFLGCSGFTGTLRFPNTVEWIGGRAFFGCTGFGGTLILPDFSGTQVEYHSVGDNAFAFTRFEGTVRIPKELINIFPSVFTHCERLTAFEAEEGYGWSFTVGGILYHYIISWDFSIRLTINQIPAGWSGTVRFPERLWRIDSYAAAGCTQLTGTLKLPDSVEEIMDGAFSDCGLSHIIIPASVRSISDGVFSKSYLLRSVVFEGDVPDMGPNRAYYTFQDTGRDVGGVKIICYASHAKSFTESDLYDAGEGTWCGCPLIVLDDADRIVLSTDSDCFFAVNGTVLTGIPGSTSYEAFMSNFENKSLCVCDRSGRVLDEEYSGTIGTGFKVVALDETGNVTDEATVVVAGDLNGDGKVSAVDRLLLARVLAKWDGYLDPEADMRAADLDRDGNVTAADRMILTKMINGKKGM